MPSISLIRKLDSLDPSLKVVLYDLIEEIERNREESVTKVEFKELKDIVSDLSVNMGKLIVAQKNTDESIKELRDSQKKTDESIKELRDSQKELVEAQKKTDETVKELVEAQKKTDESIKELRDSQKELVEAQKKTEWELQKLVKEHGFTRKQLGGLDKDVAFHLEDMSYKALPSLLKRDYGLIVKGELKRDYLPDRKGEEIEINILGRGVKDGNVYLIIGESKCQLTDKDIDHFIKSRLKRFEGVYKEEIFPLIITYMVRSPKVREHAKKPVYLFIIPINSDYR